MNVVIVGRPNVGKSSLFNRLLGRKRSLVLDTPGVTRDRIVEPVTWWIAAKQYELNLIDTGGLGHERFKEEIAMQVQTALEEADIVLFVMDIREGLTHADEEVFNGLRRAGLRESLPVIGVLNKADNDTLEEEINQFYKFGLDHVVAVSAEHKLGIEELQEMVIELSHAEPIAVKEEIDFAELTEEEAIAKADEEAALEMVGRGADASRPESLDEIEENYIPRTPNIAIIGQPNVGKSTMLNAICGQKRTIVSPIAGTTVDAIDTKINWRGKDFIMIDTAGIRRKNKTEQGIEVLSVVQTRKTLERADVALLLIDAEKGVYDQDEKIAGMIEEMGCSVILVLNKWDTQQNNDEFSQKAAEEMLRKQIRFLGYAPLVFTTAKDGLGLDRLFRMVEHVVEQRTVKINTREITDFIRAEILANNPFNAKFYLVHQTGRHPPTFRAHVSDPKKIHFSLARHLVKAIRAKWGFLGTPIRFHFLKAKNSSEK
jgi:GTP-binding protein